MLKLLLGFLLGFYLAVQYPGVLSEWQTQLFSVVAARTVPETVRDPLPSSRAPTPLPLPSPASLPPSATDVSAGEREVLRRAQWAEVRNVIEKSREGNP